MTPKGVCNAKAGLWAIAMTNHVGAPGGVSGPEALASMAPAMRAPVETALKKLQEPVIYHGCFTAQNLADGFTHNQNHEPRCRKRRNITRAHAF